MPTTIRHWLLALPAIAPPALAEALAWLVEWLNRLRMGTDEFAPIDRGRLKPLLERMSRYATRGYNNRYLLSAAHGLGIPWLPLPGGVFQYGWGSRGRWMDSTFTQSTSIISCKAARNKAVAGALLRQAGLPVPEHRVVKSLDTAIEAAAALGYPVVVKPLNQDGGVGVSASLASEAELRAAFEPARKYAEDLLVEKHVGGRNYRVYIFRGRAVGATERIPGGVTGDGTRSVRELVAAENRDPRRGDDDWSLLARLVLDEEALELLALAGLTADSVPEAGRFVRLRRAANISMGGIPVPVFDRMHPDNATLCERAAHALRLDLAGVDLLIPDIARSWRETGAAICEVNAQLQLSTLALPHFHAELLRKLVPGDGRIPSALVLSSGNQPSIVRESAELLSRLGIRAGTVSAEGVYVGAHCIRAKRGPILPDTRAVLIDQSSEAILLDTDGRDLASTGLPLDRFDLFAIADWSPPADRRAPVPSVEGLRDLLSLLAPHCTGDVLIARGHPGLPVVTAAMGKQRVRVIESPKGLPSAIAAAIRLTADGRVVSS
ncbi:MAG: acetate--CoA ligase family protein [Steroidobacteraceae bacterium]|nr:acetate--CoA ligase family protein [Steroidobacteraceae bacterium]